LVGMRKQTKTVKVGDLLIGGGNPVSVQSMTSTPTKDVNATLSQINKLIEAGCELVRVSVPDEDSVDAFKKIKANSSVPVIADIHFHWHLAIGAIEAGADKVRINPGNIGGLENFKKVIDAAKNNGCALRIGVNSGSLSQKYKSLKEKQPAEALVKSALEFLDFSTSLRFEDIVLSVKSSSVTESIKANKLLSNSTDFPIHLGVTEAGTLISGSIKSAVGLGVLLNEGIGDTIRVSLTDNPVREIETAYKILQALDIRKRGIDIISCPTCARCEVDVISLAKEAEKRLEKIAKPIKVAIMGCVVNGPGEAKDADIGIASGKKNGILFVKGKVVAKYPEDELLEALIKKTYEFVEENDEIF
jgi:(E)-4-hydroxy-3-methylbut-2-enyl-diphosphate synthase